MAQLVKKPHEMQEIRILSLSWEDPLEKGKATHSSILDWRISWIRGVTKNQTWLSEFHIHFYHYSLIDMVCVFEVITQSYFIYFVVKVDQALTTGGSFN